METSRKYFLGLSPVMTYYVYLYNLYSLTEINTYLLTLDYGWVSKRRGDLILELGKGQNSKTTHGTTRLKAS